MNRARTPIALAALSLLPACLGAIGDPSGDDPPGESSVPPPAGPSPAANGTPASAPAPGAPGAAATCTQRPGLAPLRRLNRFAYDNAVRDLLGDDSRPAQGQLPREDASGAFSNQAEILATSPLLVQSYLDLADGIAGRAVRNRLAMLVPCLPAAGDEACARRFAQTFGRRAWRRPLSTRDVDELMVVYRAGATDGAGFAAGIQAMLEALLQAPEFLYLPEVGIPGPNGTRRLTGWEIAARLALTLWGSVPDEALLAAAEANRLTDKTHLAAEVRRLLADRRARPLVQRFAEEWLGIAEIASLPGKDTRLLPRWKPGLPALFREETRLFVEALMFAERRSPALSLFEGRESFMNAELAALYGVSGVAGSSFTRVPLPDKRTGVLTHMSLLATYAKSNQSDPIHRGKFVRIKLLCGELPSAPSDVEIKPPEPSSQLTTRERFAQHVAEPFCAGCHRLIDPIGLAFENFDAMGVWRAEENGKPVDARGELTGTDVDGPVSDAVALGARLARSQQARACIVKQWFRFTFGREDDAEDACTIAQLTASFEENGFDLAGLVADTLQTETFVARRIGGTP